MFVWPPADVCVYTCEQAHTVCRYGSQIATAVCSKAQRRSVSSRASPQRITWLQEP